MLVRPLEACLMIQGMEVIRRSDGGYRLLLSCVVCQKRVTRVDYLAFAPPAHLGTATGVLCHKQCADGRIKILTGSPHIALWRVDEMTRQLICSLDHTLES